MEKERQQRIYELLKRGLKLIENGDDLPVDWAREFFPPERREYELVYHGKESEEKILVDTMAVPLQPLSTFGLNNADWHNMLIFGDNLQVMKTLLEVKRLGKLCNEDGTTGVRLVYIDPPFATKQEFRGTQDQKAYQDKIAGAQFIEFLRKRLVLLKELLSSDGSIYVHLDYRKVHYIKLVMDEIFGENNFKTEIIWQHQILGHGGELSKEHETILRYSISKKSYFDPNTKLARIPFSKYILESAKKEKDGRWYYERRAVRANDPNRNLKTYFDPDKGKLVSDLWDDIPSYQPPGKEKVYYPTQKTEALLGRIISMSSKPGDIVLDAFAGSGTTLAVAEKLERRWIGIDCGKLAIYTIQKRMLNLSKEIGNKGSKIEPKPFTLYNAGLYDFETLRNLDWKDWRFFALQLFECKDEPHKIHGFDMDGKRQGSSVYVFNHFNKGSISRETITDIHSSIGKTVGDRCFIIAPRGAFLFQEDYLTRDDVRYYALRIPYSYINEIHRREFSALVQPNDESAVNDSIEAVGFDFIQPPIVELDIKALNKKNKFVDIKIKKFESRARLRGLGKVSKFDSLSMVMLDFDYNGKVFDLDRVFYGHDLEKTKWVIKIPDSFIKGDIMLAFLDIYGNESFNIIKKEQIINKLKRKR